MQAVRRLAATAALATSLAGCSVGGMGAIGPVASAAPPPAPAPEPVSYGAFLEGPVGQKLAPADRDKALAFHHALQEEGIRTNQNAKWFLSVAHDDAIIDETLAAADRAMATLQ